MLHHEPRQGGRLRRGHPREPAAGDAALYNIPPERARVSGYSVGIRTFDPSTGHVGIDTLIKKNMPLPARLNKTYYTTRANQERLVLDFVQFRDQREASVSLGAAGDRAAQRAAPQLRRWRSRPSTGRTAPWPSRPMTPRPASSWSTCSAGRGGDGAGHLASQRSLVRNTVINGLIT